VSRVNLFERLTQRSAPRRLRVDWFDAWHPVLDEALRELPEMEGCPHELYRTLMERRSRPRKITALVTEAGQPVAVVGLRRRERHWEPVTQSVIPHPSIPSKDGYLVPSLAALNVDVWMRYQDKRPLSEDVRNIVPLPTYGIDTRADFEAFWRSTGIFKDIRLARNRTRGFTLVVDRDDATSWTISRWAEKWADHPADETAVSDDLLLASEYQQQRGQHHAFLLLDERGVPVAGRTFFVHRNALVSSCAYYSADYRRQGVGNRIYELFFAWASTSPYVHIDLGGWHSYKARWAPEAGTLWSYNVSPTRIRLVKTFYRLCRRSIGR
jgi:hypothetical protein